MPLHPNPQDHGYPPSQQRHSLHNQHHRDCHCLHHLLPFRDPRHPRQRHLHRDRVSDPHSHQLPLHRHQSSNLHPRRARHLHRLGPVHLHRLHLHHRLPQQHHSRRAWPQGDCYLHCKRKSDGHRYQRPIHHEQLGANDLGLHPNCPCYLPGRYHRPRRIYPSGGQLRLRCRTPAFLNRQTIHRCCQQAQRCWCRWSLGSRCLHPVEVSNLLHHATAIGLVSIRRW